MVSKFRSLVLASFILSGYASAATFSTTCETSLERNGGCTIVMTGEIVKGDSQRLIDHIRSGKNSRSHFYRRILLNSPGGSVSEALSIAQIVIDNVLDTNTSAYWLPLEDKRERNGICVSACFLIWVAGAKRESYSRPPGNQFGLPPAGLGLHRPFFSSDEFVKLSPSAAAKAQQDLISQIRGYLKRNDIPDSLIDEMIRRSSREVYWLDSMDRTDEALDGMAPWFEELMISKCKYDPEFDRQINYFVGGKMPSGEPISQQQKEKYFAWRQNYNACEYAFRNRAQERFVAAR